MVHATGPEYHSVPTWRVALYRATFRRGHHRGTARRRAVRACRLRRLAGGPRAVPKVVFIVGPAGAATSGYRAQARSAATIARQYTPDVVELYSPNATWTAVKDALKGASLVVYMGHGNGWPSRYRDSLYPITQDGFGLNPTAGGGDYQHQYFGEASVASEVKLAKNAVVLLNHLCYASGNSEPGLPEGTLDVAKQRVDNYAAGFIRAGASAVIAEAWSSPSYFVRAILGGGRSIQSAWLKSPSANGHRIAFSSERSPGYVAQMDPESATLGLRALDRHEERAGTEGRPGRRRRIRQRAAAPAAPLEPTLSGTGLTLGSARYRERDHGRIDGQCRRSVHDQGPQGAPQGPAGQRSLGSDRASSIAPVDPATEVAPGSSRVRAGAPGQPGPRRPAPGAKPSTAPASAPAAKAPPGRRTAAQGLHRRPRPAPRTSSSPRRPVTSSRRPPAKVGKSSFTVPVTLPSVPGHYRLTVTLHDGEGEAYDDATQAMIPTLNVRVTGDYDVAIDVVPAAQLTTQPGSPARDPRHEHRQARLGPRRGQHAVRSKRTGPGRRPSSGAGCRCRPGRPSTRTRRRKRPTRRCRSPFASGQKADAILGLTAPSTPGDYLLLLDVVTPERGSLVASGADPTLVRITVVAPG